MYQMITTVMFLLKTSVAKDGPINVTNPNELFLIILEIDKNHVFLVFKSKPLATLMYTGIFSNLFANISSVELM